MNRLRATIVATVSFVLVAGLSLTSHADVGGSPAPPVIPGWYNYL